MDTATVDKRMAALRADDGGIARLLAELDVKFDAWLAAMRAAQAAATGRPAAAADPPVAPPAATAPRAAEAPPAPTTGAHAAPPPEGRAAEPRAPAPPTAGTEPKARRGGGAAEKPGPRLFRGGRPERSQPEPAAGEDAGLSADDAALLATLDAETANAIRVKRRLTGGRKSVRELLQELRAGPPAAAPRPPPERGSGSGRRWWRRGDE